MAIQGSSPTTRQVKVGVLGAGYWGPKLIRNFHEIPDADMTVVCDLQQSRLAHIQELYPNVRLTTNYHEVLESDVEAVAIATPILTHHRLA